MVPMVIWFPSIFELLFDESKKVIESMTPQGPHGRRQLTRVNLYNVLDEGLMIGGRGCWMNSKVKDHTNKAKHVM
jgi:hypothetical protein